MDLSVYFNSVLEQDSAAIVLCSLQHEIIYMNPAAVKKYAKYGGSRLIGSSLLECHNQNSRDRIAEVVKWFSESTDHNIVYTYNNPNENKDVYMVALRDSESALIGYYEKHEYRNPETRKLYCLD